MNTRILSTLLVLCTLICMVACTPDEDPSTAVFRAAMVSERDISMDQAPSTSGAMQALNGDPSEIAAITADTVRFTDALLKAQFQLIGDIIQLDPTTLSDTEHVWQLDGDEVSLRLSMSKSDAPRGDRFDYSLDVSQSSDRANFSPLLDGHVVRLSAQTEDDNQGWGIVRFYFTNLSANFPDEHNTKGIARIAFRNVGKVGQVRTKLLNMDTPDDPDFPENSLYNYTVLPNNSGGFQWFSRGDLMEDGAPFEDFSVHSRWRADFSGLGQMRLQGGSLAIEGTPVDFLQKTECWDSSLHNGFERNEAPNYSMESGDPLSCFGPPADELDVLAINPLEDEDPALPEAHGEE